MPALNDLTGKTFSRLLVLRRYGVSTNGKATWRCRCQCGRETVAVGSEMLSGHTTSCGCWRAERNRTSDLSHGMHGTPTYKSWEAMKARCLNPASNSFADYGGRGITVCERWRISFEAFLADMGPRPAGTTLDRFPNMFGNYEPENCRWATRKQQQRNTTANVVVACNGCSATVAEWSERTGIKASTLHHRLKAGWTPKQALYTPARLGNRVALKFGEEVELP